MPLQLTNSVLTQIAVKRLSGKALTNPNNPIGSENFGSFIQQSTSTIFAQSIPNNPEQTEFLIQSSSDDSPGTVAYIEFDLEIIGDAYQAVGGNGGGDGSAEETVFGQDIGTSTFDTFHAYALKLPSDFQTEIENIGTQDFGDDASTDVSLGTFPYKAGAISTGSNKFQIVPEYLSTIVDNTNPYIPTVIATSGGEIPSTDEVINWYLDAASGILFVQDPNNNADFSTNSAYQPEKIKAFLYVGKYQDEVSTGGGDVAIAGTFSPDSAGDDGGTISLNTTNPTASFSSSIGLSIFTASAGGSTVLMFGTSSDRLHVESITAEEYIINSTVTNVTQSFSSGSNIFGDTNDDTHEITGSVSIIQSASNGSVIGETPALNISGGFFSLNSGSLDSAGRGFYILPSPDGGSAAVTMYADSKWTISSSLGSVAVDAKNWKVTAGGNLHTKQIGADVGVGDQGGYISASGFLYASASEWDGTGGATQQVVIYDDTDGRFYTTASNTLSSTALFLITHSTDGGTGVGFTIGDEANQTASFSSPPGLSISTIPGTPNIIQIGKTVDQVNFKQYTASIEGYTMTMTNLLGNPITASVANQLGQNGIMDFGQAGTISRFKSSPVNLVKPVTGAAWYSSSYITNTALAGDQNEGNLGSAFIARGAQFEYIYSNVSASKTAIRNNSSTYGTSSIELTVAEPAQKNTQTILSVDAYNNQNTNLHDNQHSRVVVNPGNNITASFLVNRSQGEASKADIIQSPAFHVLGDHGTEASQNYGLGTVGFGVERGPGGPLGTTNELNRNAPHIVIDTVRALPGHDNISVSASGQFKIKANEATQFLEYQHILTYNTESGLIQFVTGSQIGGGGGGQDDDWLIEEDWDGLGNARLTSSRDVLIEGNLTVIGQGTYENTVVRTENLVVEDRFIHLASGSGAGGGKNESQGISFETTAEGSGSVIFLTEEEPATAGSGYSGGGGNWQSLAFYSGSGDEIFDPYGNNNPISPGTNRTDMPAKVTGRIPIVSMSESGPPTSSVDNYSEVTPALGGGTMASYGQMYVDTTDSTNGGLYIWLP